MMDLQTIRELSEEAAEQAKANGDQPVVFTQRQLDKAKDGDIEAIRRMPNLGTYLPKGWARVNMAAGHGIYAGDNDGYGAMMVDASGFGKRGEAALTLGEFIDKLKPGLGYGIVEAGQFQVKIGAFAVITGRG